MKPTLPPEAPLNRKSQIAYRKLIWEKVPFFILAALDCVVTFLVQKSGDAVVKTAALPLSARIANALVSYTLSMENGLAHEPGRAVSLFPTIGAS